MSIFKNKRQNSGKEIAGELSHGEMQWLEIGMTLAMEPSLLLLDEPTAGMTRNETKKTGEIIKPLEDKRELHQRRPSIS